MNYILQNAIQIFHRGNSIILNSRLDGSPQVYKYNGRQFSIDGGRNRFIHKYDNTDDLIIRDLRLTLDSTIEEMADKLLWASTERIEESVDPIFTWKFIKDLPKYKLKRILEEGLHNLSPMIYKVINYVYNTK